MRNSDDLDSIVARFRPAGPPPELRERVLTAAGARGFSRAILRWLPAAAALLVAVLFHWLATTEQAQLSEHFSLEPTEVSTDVLTGVDHD